MTLSESISTCFAKFATFQGRASRSEYWWFILAVTIFTYLLQIVVGITTLTDADEGLGAAIGMNIIVWILFIPEISAGSRRLHDVGKSGWWQLIAFTVIGLIPLIIWMARVGDKEPNRFGDPLTES